MNKEFFSPPQQQLSLPLKDLPATRQCKDKVIGATAATATKPPHELHHTKKSLDLKE